jgi:hypothetical protein
VEAVIGSTEKMIDTEEVERISGSEGAGWMLDV